MEVILNGPAGTERASSMNTADRQCDTAAAVKQSLMPEAEIDECVDEVKAATDAKLLLGSHLDFDSKMKTMQKQLFIDLVKVPHRKFQDFFQGEDMSQILRSHVTEWLTDMNSSTQDASQLNASQV